jgi:hypothetical protein
MADDDVVDRIGQRELELKRMVDRSVEDRGGIYRKGVLKIPADKLKPKFRKGGMVKTQGRDYAK